MPRCPLITGGVIIRCFYQASHSQVTKCFIIPPSGERASGHTVSVAWGVSGIPAGGPAGPPKPGDRAGRRWGGSRAPAGPLWGTGTVGRCCREPGPRPRPPRAGLTSVRGVTSSRQTLMPVVSLPARFLGLGQEPAWKPTGVREKAEACAGLADPDPASSRPDWPGLRAGRSRPRHEVTGRGHGAPLSLGLGLHAGPAACEPGGRWASIPRPWPSCVDRQGA